MPVIVGKTIDQLNQVTAITASDEIVVYDAEAGTGVEPTKKITGQNAAESLKNLGNMVDLSDIAPAYSASATYSVGDYCVYNGAFYKCSTAITTAEPWTAAHWTQTTVQAELALKVNTTDVVNNLTSGGTTVPLSAEMGKTLNNKKTSYNALIDNVEITRAATDYTLYNSRKLSDYVLMYICPIIGGYIRFGTTLPISTFQSLSSTGTSLTIKTGGEDVEIVIKYVSDTKVNMKYNASSDKNVHIALGAFV